MKLKELLAPLTGSTPVNIFDENEKRVARGSCFNLWAHLDYKIENAPVTSFSTNRGNIDVYINVPQPTNYDKLKELFPNILRTYSGSGTVDDIHGIDGVTGFRREWLDAKYEGDEKNE